MKKKLKKPKNYVQSNLNTKNSKILYDTMVTLGALKEGGRLVDMPINEIQVHLLDKDGDGIVLCLEYDERTGELNKTFHNIPEEIESEVPHYYGEEFGDSIDPCTSPENVKEFLRKRIEETISEEYDEIFHNSDGNDDEEPLLN